MDSLLKALLGLTVILAPASISATVLSGEVVSRDAQEIFAPQSRVVPVPLRTFITDGELVKPGQTVVAVDSGFASSELEKLCDSLDDVRLKEERDVAEARVKAMDAQISLVSSISDRDTAGIDAKLPKALISALDFDRYQSELTRSEVALSAARADAESASAASSRISSEADLEVQRIQIRIDDAKRQVDMSRINATHEGTVVHAVDQFSGNEGRYEEGSGALPGVIIGEVIGGSTKYDIHLWGLKVETSDLRLGQTLRLRADALPNDVFKGKVAFISGAAVKKPDWGEASYVEVTVEVEDPSPQLMPGMNVTADSDLADAAFNSVRSDSNTSVHWELAGELIARRENTLSAPDIPGVSDMTVTKIANDGQAVQKDDVVITFDQSGIGREISQRQADLNEEVRKRDALLIDLAGRAKKEVLAVASARADAEKAKLKAAAPKAYTPGREYQKLQINLKKTESTLALIAAHAKLASQERQTELSLADATIKRLQGHISRLADASRDLTIRASNGGVFIRQIGFNGKKVEAGSQLFPGQTAASIPDLTSLAVRVQVPERSIASMHVGETVLVSLSGADTTSVRGHIASLGSVVHSESRTDQLPVVSMIVMLEKIPRAFRPGQLVRVSATGGA